MLECVDLLECLGNCVLTICVAIYIICRSSVYLFVCYESHGSHDYKSWFMAGSPLF